MTFVKYHTRPAENIILQQNALVNRDVVLNLHIVPHNNVSSHKHVLTQNTIPANPDAFHDMTVVPNLCSLSNGTIGTDYGSRMDKYALQLSAGLGFQPNGNSAPVQ